MVYVLRNNYSNRFNRPNLQRRFKDRMAQQYNTKSITHYVCVCVCVRIL